MIMRELKIADSVLRITQGDITEQNTEAVVNAANARLAPGGGVAGAIHRAAGPKLWEECKTLGGCTTGDAKITRGYNLKADYVIHTVGPVYHNVSKDAQLLKSCYKKSLKLAEKHGIKTISFPAISTGAFGYPMDNAAEIAIITLVETLHEIEMDLVQLVLHSSSSYAVHEKKLMAIKEKMNP